jgi:hypothetical protein
MLKHNKEVVMKQLTKLTYVVMVTLALSFAVGCGESQESETETQNSVLNPNTGFNASAGNTISQHFPMRANGMYDGSGVENIQQKYTGQIQVGSHRWHTRLEFLTQAGGAVDPASFNPPLGLAKVRVTLVNEQNPNQKYQADGVVWVRINNLALIGTLRSSDTNGAAKFDIQFGYRPGDDGPVLGFGKLNGLLHAGSVVLTDYVTQQKHVIQYGGIF